MAYPLGKSWTTKRWEIANIQFKKTHILHKCIICNKNFWIYKSEIKKGLKRGNKNTGKFCSHFCYSKFIIGKKYPKWMNKIKSKLLKGIKFSEEHKQKLKEAWIRGKRNGRKTIFEKMKGNFSKKWIQIISQAKIGNKNPQWRGGTSFLPYPSEFNLELKRQIFERDGFICNLCKMTQQESIKKYYKSLFVNHIDFNKKNCSKLNLNLLCASCSGVVNFNRQMWTDYFKRQNIEKQYAFV